MPWQDEQEKMFLKYRVRTKEREKQSRGFLGIPEVKPGSLWLRGKVRTQAESRAPSVTHQCFEGLDEGVEKSIGSGQRRARQRLQSPTGFRSCSAKSSQNYF